MALPMQHIIQHLFNTASLANVPREQLEELVEEYPSFGVARYLLSRKLHAEGHDNFSGETLKTNLYFNNPYWLQWLLKNNEEGSVDAVEAGRIPAEHAVHVVDEPAEPSTGIFDEPAAPSREVGEPLYGSAEEARAATAEHHAVEDVPAAEIGETPAARFEEAVVEAPEEPQTVREEMPAADAPGTGSAEPILAEGPSAADQLLESIAALRLTHQRAAEEAAAVPAEAGPAHSMVAMALEQADDQSVENIDGTPPLPEESEESAGAVLTNGEYADLHGAGSRETDALLQGMAAGPTGDASVEGLAGETGQAPATGSGGVSSDAEVSRSGGSTEGPAEKQETGPVLSPILEPIVAFEPFHTIDYFASQGIRLTLDENPSDKLGKQLKSFTDWLKVMRKLPQQTGQSVPDIAAEHKVRAIAAHSIEGKEVVTETMAEVLVKQGMREKAVDMYRKLSLLDPDKSAYFANKIEELKID